MDPTALDILPDSDVELQMEDLRNDFWWARFQIKTVSTEFNYLSLSRNISYDEVGFLNQLIVLCVPAETRLI